MNTANKKGKDMMILAFVVAFAVVYYGIPAVC